MGVFVWFSLSRVTDRSVFALCVIYIEIVFQNRPLVCGAYESDRRAGRYANDVPIYCLHNFNIRR